MNAGGWCAVDSGGRSASDAEKGLSHAGEGFLAILVYLVGGAVGDDGLPGQAIPSTNGFPISRDPRFRFVADPGQSPVAAAFAGGDNGSSSSAGALRFRGLSSLTDARRDPSLHGR